jgi:hypothetical protein
VGEKQEKRRVKISKSKLVFAKRVSVDISVELGMGIEPCSDSGFHSQTPHFFFAQLAI